MNIILLVFAYFIIPFVAAFFVHGLCKRLMAGYSDDIYQFEIPKQ